MHWTKRTEVAGSHSLPTGCVCYDYGDAESPAGYGTITYNLSTRCYSATYFGRTTTRRTTGTSLVAAQHWIERQTHRGQEHEEQRHA